MSSTFLALLPGFTGGAAISYAAVALPFYLDPENGSGMVMTEDQASWFGKGVGRRSFFMLLDFSEPKLSHANGRKPSVWDFIGQVWEKTDVDWKFFSGYPCFSNFILCT